MNPKQKIFCDEYLVSLNATEAAIKAGYSKKTARSIGQENLTKPDIKKYIKTNILIKINAPANNRHITTAKTMFISFFSIIQL